MFDIPILIIGFNRPEAIRGLIKILEKIEPQKIYIFVDGARENVYGEDEKVEEVKKIVEKEIHWTTRKMYNFPEENLNCRYGPATAITWFFENEEMGIILEDDVRPDLSFFPYMEVLLVYYKDDQRIGHITGRNDLGIYDIGYSYNFYEIGSVWGWGTWRRAWKDFSLFDELWTNYEVREAVESKLNRSGFKDYLISKLEQVVSGKKQAWDYIWSFTNIAYDRKAIYPKKNLVKNVGFGKDATHTTSITADKVESYCMDEEIIHPPFCCIDYRYYDNLEKRKNSKLAKIIRKISR